MRQSLYDYCHTYAKEYLLTEWDGEKNLPLTPQSVSYGSKKKVSWRCKQGHAWQAVVYTRTRGSGCPYCTGLKIEVGKADLQSRFPELMKQWHPEKNKELTPALLPAGSNRKVWWRCEKGHEWQAVIKSRTGGCGCPVCANRVVIPGENDLATTHQELARQWDTERNAFLTPTQVTAGTQKKVWWRCEKGHSWNAEIASRVKGSNCPACAGKVIVAGENDLASAFPYIAAQWPPTKNGDLTPENCAPARNRKVWWLCPLGHEYQAAVGTRTVNGTGCPYCAGRKVLKGFNDLATLEPKIAAQWHPTLNGTLTPDMVTVGSKRKVWWQCSDGHVWKAVIYARTGTQKCGCPVCAGRVNQARQARYAAVQGNSAQRRSGRPLQVD